MRSSRLLVVAVLAVVLALSAAQNAFATQWIFYDNGTSGGENQMDFVGVRFSLPTGVSSAHLLAVSFYWMAAPSVQGSGMVMSIQPTVGPDVTVHVTGSPSGTDLITPVDVPTAVIGWNTVDVSGGNLVVTGDFYVVIEQHIEETVAYDNTGSNFEGRSVTGVSLTTLQVYSRSLMIRAEIDPIVAPVGGVVVMPVNAFAVLAPWLVVIGLVGCIGTAVVIAKKRRT
jgi:hypothetical protein